MKYTLNNYSPWIDLENSVLRKYCKLNITIDVPEGWKVEVDRGGGMIDGYMALPAFGWGYIWLNYLYESTGINVCVSLQVGSISVYATRLRFY